MGSPLSLSLFFSFSHTGLINEPNARSYRRKPSCPTFEWLARSCPIRYDPIRPLFINRRIDIAHALERGFALLFFSPTDCSQMKYLPFLRSPKRNYCVVHHVGIFMRRLESNGEVRLFFNINMKGLTYSEQGFGTQ